MPPFSRRSMLQTSAYLLGGAGLAVMAPASARKPEETQRLKIVVSGAHPDDPETGCGGTMALLAKEGHEVISLYLTRGEAGIPGTAHDQAAAIRTKEAQKACELLGAKPAFLGQIDGSTILNGEWYDKAAAFFETEQPDIIFAHWPIDTHSDHRISSLLTYESWRRLGQRPALYYYEVMSGSQSQNFAPTHFIDITSTLTQKHEACFAHVSQFIKETYDDDHGKMEVFRGMEYGCQYAEAFVAHHQNPRGIR